MTSPSARGPINVRTRTRSPRSAAINPIRPRREPQRDPVIEAAVRYVCEGFRVVPLNEERRPVWSGWQADATDDLEEIQHGAMFIEPDDGHAPVIAGVGVLTGGDGDLMVLDVDGEEGEGTLRNWISTCGELPETRQVGTPNGRHIHFMSLYPLQTWTIGAGLELKGESMAGAPGYVPMPPSRRSERGIYEWINERLPSELPRAWAEALWEQQCRREEQRGPDIPASDREPTEYERNEAQRHLDNACRRIAALSPGGRRNAINAIAYRVGQHLWALPDEDQVFDRLRHAAIRCGWWNRDPARAGRTIRDALRDGSQRPQGFRHATLEFRGPPHLPRIDEAAPEGLPLSDDAAPEAVPAQPRAPMQTVLHVECSQFELNDIGNADRFTRRYSDTVRWSPGLGWLAWDGCRWRPEDLFALALAKETARSVLAEAAMVEDDERREMLTKWARQSGGASRINGMLRLAKPDVLAPTDQFDRDPWLLNVENGTVDLRTGELMEHRREDLITKLAPVEYSPDAQCPRWEQFMREIFAEDEELIRYVQRAVGYSLTGMANEQCLFFLHGDGSNGKGVLIWTLHGLLGDYAQRTKPQAFLEQSRSNSGGPTPDMARMRGTRLVITSEVKDGAALAEGLIKELTGEEGLTARMLYGQPIEFEPVMKVWFAANHRPIIRGTDHAIWRRIKMIPFNVTFSSPDDPNHRDGNPPKDPGLRDALRAEWSGVLAWAVRGCLEWQRGGLRDPEVVREAIAEYRSDQDVLGQFLSERCEIERGATATQTALRQAYERWCEDRGDAALGGRRFRSELLSRGFRHVGDRTNRGRWQGLRLRTDNSQTFPGIAAMQRPRSPGRT